MNNFTKSIVYSGVVLAAGLIAIFAIYNNMSTSPANMMATMEPAAGEEAVMEDGAAAAVEDAAAAVEETATEAVEGAAEAAAVVSDCTMEDGVAGKLDAEGVCGPMPEAATEAVEGAAEAVEGAAEAVEGEEAAH